MGKSWPPHKGATSSKKNPIKAHFIQNRFFGSLKCSDAPRSLSGAIGFAPGYASSRRVCRQYRPGGTDRACEAGSLPEIDKGQPTQLGVPVVRIVGDKTSSW